MFTLCHLLVMGTMKMERFFNTRVWRTEITFSLAESFDGKGEGELLNKIYHVASGNAPFVSLAEQKSQA